MSADLLDSYLAGERMILDSIRKHGPRLLQIQTTEKEMPMSDEELEALKAKIEKDMAEFRAAIQDIHRQLADLRGIVFAPRP